MRASIHRDKVFEGARFDLYRVPFPAREGGAPPAMREVVVPNDAVVILPLLDAETVVLIRNRRPALDKTLWELPAGTREPDEPADAAAAREVTEETGYRAARLTRLTAFYAAPGFCTERLDAYLAEGLERVGQSLDATEEILVQPTPLNEVLTMIRDGTIEDAKSIATLLYYHAFVMNGPGSGERT